MSKYKVETEEEKYYVEADSKNKARKEVLEKENITIEKTEDYDDDTYWQRNPIYKGEKLGNTNTSMQDSGCALMCWSYVSRKDPLEVNQLFIDEGVYRNDLIIFEKACQSLGFKNYEKSTDINRMPEQDETIKEVTLGKGQHFVVRMNKNGERWIFDPWTGEDKTINYYSFRSYRIFDKD